MQQAALFDLVSPISKKSNGELDFLLPHFSP